MTGVQVLRQLIWLEPLNIHVEPIGENRIVQLALAEGTMTRYNLRYVLSASRRSC